MLSKVKKRVDKFHLACNTKTVKKLTLVVTLQLLLSELEILLTVGRPFVDWTAFFYFPHFLNKKIALTKRRQSRAGNQNKHSYRGEALEAEMPPGMIELYQKDTAVSI